MKHIAREFDALQPLGHSARVTIDRASAADVAAIYPRIAVSLSQHIATLETCQSIRRRHLDNVWSISDRRGGRLLGLYAMAMLSEAGHAALLAGRFDAHDPRLAHVAATGERVAAIYKWGVYAPGIAAAAIPLVAERLLTPDYRHLDLFGNGVTPEGRRIMTSLGFRPVETPGGARLYRYARLANRLPLPEPPAGFPI